MWEYNYDYLSHGGRRNTSSGKSIRSTNHKYIDKYRNRKGEWTYVYPDDNTIRKRTKNVSEGSASIRDLESKIRDVYSYDPEAAVGRYKANRKAAEANKYANERVENRIRNEAKDRYNSELAKTREANRKGMEAAEKARGENRIVQENQKHLTTAQKKAQADEQRRIKSASYRGAQSKDINDYEKAERTKQALKNATRRQKEYEANEKGSEAAEKARGENYKIQNEQVLTPNKPGGMSKDLFSEAKRRESYHKTAYATINNKLSNYDDKTITEFMRKISQNKKLSKIKAKDLFEEYKDVLLERDVDPDTKPLAFLQTLYKTFIK